MTQDFDYFDFSDLHATSIGEHTQLSVNENHIDRIHAPSRQVEYGFVSTTKVEAEELHHQIPDSTLVPNTGIVVAPMAAFQKLHISRQQPQEFTFRVSGGNGIYR